MTHRQWIRDISLVVGKAGGKGIELRGLKIAFDILKTDTETPNSAQISVWNLADETAQQIRDEFDTVILNAGYVEAMGMIYRGNIIQVHRRRDGSVDKVTEIACGDGDQAYQYAMVSKTIAAGASQKDILEAATGAMSEHGVEAGYVPDLGTNTLPRGKVIHRASRDVIRDVCHTSGTSWSIQDGKLNLIELDKTLPGKAVLLTPSTGLIGYPEQTTEGVKVTCLLNAEIRVGGKIKIEGEIAEFKRSAEPAESAGVGDKSPASLAADGVYRVIECRYRGDTFKNEWFCEVLGVAMDATSDKTTD